MVVASGDGERDVQHAASVRANSVFAAARRTDPQDVAFSISTVREGVVLAARCVRRL
jgi:hypothetical protein